MSLLLIFRFFRLFFFIIFCLLILSVPRSCPPFNVLPDVFLFSQFRSFHVSFNLSLLRIFLFFTSISFSFFSIPRVLSSPRSLDPSQHLAARTRLPVNTGTSEGGLGLLWTVPLDKRFREGICFGWRGRRTRRGTRTRRKRKSIRIYFPCIFDLHFLHLPRFYIIFHTFSLFMHFFHLAFVFHFPPLFSLLFVLLLLSSLHFYFSSFILFHLPSFYSYFLSTLSLPPPLYLHLFFLPPLLLSLLFSYISITVILLIASLAYSLHLSSASPLLSPSLPHPYFLQGFLLPLPFTPSVILI